MRILARTLAPLLGLTLLLSLSACATSIYELPPPPPEDEWIDDAADPKAEERRQEMMYIEARTAALALFNLLSNQRYQEASTRVSSETRDFVTSGGDASFDEILASGKMPLPNGEVVEIDPVSTLLGPDLSKIRDTVDGISENETDARRELFVELPDGGFQRIVMIKEAGAWVLHRTRLPEPVKPESPES